MVWFVFIVIGVDLVVLKGGVHGDYRIYDCVIVEILFYRPTKFLLSRSILAIWVV